MSQPQAENLFSAIQHLNDPKNGLEWEKETFSPAEQVAIIALRPFLSLIGGRIMQMVDMGIEKGKS